MCGTQVTRAGFQAIFLATALPGREYFFPKRFIHYSSVFSQTFRPNLILILILTLTLTQPLPFTSFLKFFVVMDEPFGKKLHFGLLPCPDRKKCGPHMGFWLGKVGPIYHIWAQCGLHVGKYGQILPTYAHTGPTWAKFGRFCRMFLDGVWLTGND